MSSPRAVKREGEASAVSRPNSGEAGEQDGGSRGGVSGANHDREESARTKREPDAEPGSREQCVGADTAISQEESEGEAYRSASPYCRKGRFALGRKLASKRMSRNLKVMGEQLRGRANKDTTEARKWPGRVMQGWFSYFAVSNSMRYLRRFVRSWKDRFAWGKLESTCKRLWPRARILHP